MLVYPGLAVNNVWSKFKKDERLKFIPVIICTGSNDIATAIELKKMGAVHFITKPWDLNELYYILSAVFDEKWETN